MFFNLSLACNNIRHRCYNNCRMLYNMQHEFNNRRGMLYRQSYGFNTTPRMLGGQRSPESRKAHPRCHSRYFGSGPGDSGGKVKGFFR